MGSPWTEHFAEYQAGFLYRQYNLRMMKKGFTLTEMIIGMLITSILILTIGVMSSTGISSYSKLRKQAEAYNEIYSAVSFIEHSVRGAKNISLADNTLTAKGLKDPSNLIYDCTITRVDPDNNLMYNLIYNDTLGHTSTIVNDVANLTISPSNDFSNDKLLNATINGTIILDGNKPSNFSLPFSVMRRNG